MASNFDFLRAGWPTLHAEAVRAEQFVIADPRTACFYARRTLEHAVLWLYEADRTLSYPYRDDLAAMLAEPTMGRLVGHDVATKMDLIRRRGNAAVHRNKPITAQDALAVVRELFHVTYWIARRYTVDQEDVPSSGATFDSERIQRPGEARRRTQAEVEALHDELAEKDEQLARRERDDAGKDAEIARLRTEVAAAKARNDRLGDDHDYDEAATRDLYIDVLLGEAGWTLENDWDTEFEVTGMPNETGVGYVDYVLWGDDGRPLGLVEAKRTRRDPLGGQQQARLYADRLEAAYGQRPVIFYTNGYETWLWDDASYPPRRAQGFYTKDELALLIGRRTSRKPLAEATIDSRIVERHYQQRAIRSIDAAFESSRQRSALLVMATGAGKTRTVIALVDQLMRANWVKRVLFLADRTALVKQSTDAFKAHLPDVTTVNLVTERSANGRVYVSTYPTMMNLIDRGNDTQRRFGPGYFDLVVIDEAHRSVYQKYRAIFDYFDSLLVGLTATPRDEVDRNTYSLLALEDGVPTDYYDLEDAVAEGYLVPWRAVSVPLKFQREGIRYDDLSEAEKDQWDTLDWDEDGDVPTIVEPDAVNKWLFNTDTVDKVLETLMTHGHRVAGGDRIGKTIIFAKNNAHAKFIAERFDHAYPEHAGSYARMITHKTEYAQSLIDDFAAADKPPYIAISVDMLDTGIDIPEVVNLVFFKIVRSKTKFWQMIGRGTRLRPDLYGPGQHKQDFYIFDFCQNLEYFNQDPPTSDAPLPPSLGERLFTTRLELLATLDAQQIHPKGNPEDGTRTVDGLRWDTAHLLHDRVASMNLDNFVVRPERRWVEKYAALDHWHHIDRNEAVEISGHLAHLPAAVREDDEQAKRFDLILLRLQLGRLEPDAAYGRYREQVQQIASALLDQTTIPVIAAQQQLLDDLAGEEWWTDVTLPMLELARRRVRGLVNLIERAKRTVVYTDFADQLGEMSEVQLKNLHIGTDHDRFVAKTRAWLRAHEDHITIQKLRHNKQLTATDLAELERRLEEGGADERDLERVRRESGSLGLFIRSLVGLDRRAATDAFSAYLNGTDYNAHQIDFINLIISHLTDNGVVDPARLFESPFTDSAPHGPTSLFSNDDSAQIIDILRTVQANAATGQTVA